MRCLSCDRRLNDQESTRKYSNGIDFVDLCNRCFSYVADEIPDTEGDVPYGEEDDTESDESHEDWTEFRADRYEE